MDKHSKPLWSRKTISGNQSIAIMSDKDSQSSASQAAQDGAIYIMISPDNDEPDALYSLVVINRIASQIYLRDGVPFRMEMEVFKIITFLYVPEDEGTFIVKSKPIGDLLIEASCSSNSKAIEPVVNLIANRV